MPVMNGILATKKIRERSDNKSKLPIIAMTANVMSGEIERCLKQGMNDYIPKPFETDDLLMKIKKWRKTPDS
jgi:CheY-like chemotaxis protein